MISSAVLLFFVIDPFGLIPVYVALLGRVPPERRLPILVRELLIALLALVLFLFAGTLCARGAAHLRASPC